VTSRLAAVFAAGLIASLASQVHAQQHDHGAHGAAAAPPASSSDDGSSEFEHSPPDPPATTLPPMSHREMMGMMGMDDRARFGRVMIDQLEWRSAEGRERLGWEAWASYGSDLDKAWFKTEGSRVGGATEDARVEALWDHVVARWWSLQSGWRHDFDAHDSLDWLAIGVQGLAPGFFETELTAYLRADRVALRTSMEVDLRLTQRLVLQPTLDANAVSGSGVIDAALGLRLRYEIRREFAPYAGVRWAHDFEGATERQLQAVAGIRAWW
jgi:copper resistance protein B